MVWVKGWGRPSCPWPGIWATQPASSTLCLSATPLGDKSDKELCFFQRIFSDRLWQRLGYTLIGVVPNVARLKGIEVELCYTKKGKVY